MTERTIPIGGLAEEKAKHAVTATLGDAQPADEVADAVPKFKDYECPEFFAQWAVVNNDIVVHFYTPKGLNMEDADATTKQKWNKYWLEIFPTTISPVAKTHFMADVPRIVAKYTEEVASWWFCARGFGTSMNPAALAEGFLEKMADSLSAPS